MELSPERQPDGRLSGEAAVERINTAMQMSTPLRFDWIHKRRDGTEFPCEITLIRITLGGKPALLTSVRDITERKRAEAELQKQSDELQHINFMADSALDLPRRATGTCRWTAPAGTTPPNGRRASSATYPTPLTIVTALDALGRTRPASATRRPQDHGGKL